jgi:hypothetical protein
MMLVGVDARTAFCVVATETNRDAIYPHSQGPSNDSVSRLVKCRSAAPIGQFRLPLKETRRSFHRGRSWAAQPYASGFKPRRRCRGRDASERRAGVVLVMTGWKMIEPARQAHKLQRSRSRFHRGRTAAGNGQNGNRGGNRDPCSTEENEENEVKSVGWSS